MLQCCSGTFARMYSFPANYMQNYSAPQRSALMSRHIHKHLYIDVKCLSRTVSALSMDIIPGKSKHCKRGWLHGEGSDKRGCAPEDTEQTNFSIYTPVEQRSMAWQLWQRR